MRFYSHAAEAYPSSSPRGVTYSSLQCWLLFTHSSHHLQISQGENPAVCFWMPGSWSVRPPADRSQITNIGALNLRRPTRSTASVDEAERSNERLPVVGRCLRTRAQTMELMECYLRAYPTTGALLREWAVEKDDWGPKWKTVTIFHIWIVNWRPPSDVSALEMRQWSGGLRLYAGCEARCNIQKAVRALWA